jgi:hypothetical protein
LEFLIIGIPEFPVLVTLLAKIPINFHRNLRQQSRRNLQ